MKYQLRIKIQNASESENLDVAIYLKDNHTEQIHQVNGDGTTFLTRVTLEIVDFATLISTIQTMKAEFTDRFTYSYSMDKDT